MKGRRDSKQTMELRGGRSSTQRMTRNFLERLTLQLYLRRNKKLRKYVKTGCIWEIVLRRPEGSGTKLGGRRVATGDTTKHECVRGDLSNSIC